MITAVKLRTLATVSIFSLSLAGCLSEQVAQEPLSGGNPTTTINPTTNSAPTISGTPQSAVTLGGTYSFTPTASDADGDDLTFSIQNQPAWTSFDVTTGELSGQPSLADVGVFSQIVISVSDGQESASTPGYSVTVTQAQLGSMSLSWTPPTGNTDGTNLTDLAGYRIYYGSSAGNYPNRVDIDTPGLATYLVENLIPDTYYVVATSINSAGIESEFSNVAVKIVQ